MSCRAPSCPQVWENCRLYNPVGTAVRQMGDRLSETWEKKWYQAGIEARWEGLMRELTEEEVRPWILNVGGLLSWLSGWPCRFMITGVPRVNYLLLDRSKRRAWRKSHCTGPLGCLCLCCGAYM